MANITTPGIKFNGLDSQFGGYIYAAGAIRVPYAAATKKPMIVLNGATNYGLFHTEASDDIFSFDFNGTSKHQFKQDGTATFAGGIITICNLLFNGNSKYIDLARGTTSSQPFIRIGEQSLYGFSMRWDSGSHVQFDGWWNSTTGGSANRDFGSLDANNRIWKLEGGLTLNGHTVWHAGNDGSGSTLDADTLDDYALHTVFFKKEVLSGEGLKVFISAMSNLATNPPPRNVRFSIHTKRLART